jgi:hypothetical protein
VPVDETLLRVRQRTDEGDAPDDGQTLGNGDLVRFVGEVHENRHGQDRTA